MPAFETMDRHQIAVLWPAGAANSYGQTTVGSPVEINVRWTYARRDVLDPQGNTIAIDATVVVDRDIAIGSIMLLGELADWTGTGSNNDDEGLHQVKTFAKTPDIKGRNVRREVTLMRFNDTLPTS